MLKIYFDVSQTEPVDPELYIRCRHVFDEAAGMTTPAESVEHHVFRFDGAPYRLSDDPRVRAMRAVMDELPSRLTDAQRHSMVRRLLNLEVLVQRPEVARYVTQSGQPGSVRVNEALLRAAATARMTVSSSGRVEYDIEDVLRIASAAANGH